MKKKARASSKSSKPKDNGLHLEEPKLRPIQELIKKICRNDHTKGIIVR